MLGIAGGEISLDVECYAGCVLISTRKFGINVNMKGRWDGGMQNKDHRSRLLTPAFSVTCTLSTFECQFFNSLTVGTQEKVSAIRHDSKSRMGSNG